MFESFWLKIKSKIFGRPLRNEELEGQKMGVVWGLPVLSSDAISSVAYAGEEILWVLVPVIGLLSYHYMFLTALAIVGLLVLLVFSYLQTISHYPNGGGAYIVAKDNLGMKAGLVAGASLMMDYVLTVAVSSSAATAALTSAVPMLLSYKVEIASSLILLITVGNLRGIRDSSRLFGTPTYLFIGSVLFMIVYGVIKVNILGERPNAVIQPPPQIISGEVTLFLILRAFSGGCTALTGVEAVSNAIPNFAKPSQRNAQRVLLLLALLVLLVFGGTSYLATLYHAVPSHEMTVIAQIAYQVFDGGFMYYVIQIATLLILAMAANTAYADLPLLMALISRDGYMPRQYSERGERLAFSNGIKTLATTSVILIVLFHGETHALLPLYAIGVFVSFTLSQSGMVVRQFRLKKKGWHYKILFNALGALVTLVTVLVISITKFIAGAWIVFIVVPIIIYLMASTKNHYQELGHQLKLIPSEVETEIEKVVVKKFAVVLIDDLNKASMKAIGYAEDVFGQHQIIAFHIATSLEDEQRMIDRWESFHIRTPLVIKYSPYRDVVQPLIDYLESAESECQAGDIITVIMPEFVVAHPWQHIYHNRTADAIREHLLHERHIGVVIVPYVIDDESME